MSIPLAEQPLVQEFRQEEFNAAPIDQKGFRKEENEYYEHQYTLVPSQNVQVQEVTYQQDPKEVIEESNQYYQEYEQIQNHHEGYVVQT